MKLRKLFMFLVLGLVAFALVACGGEKEPAKDPEDDNKQQNPGEDPNENQQNPPAGPTEDAEQKVKEYVAKVAITYAEGDSKDSVTKDITLGTVEAEGLTIAWVSDKADAIDNTGKVTRTYEDQKVKLTATATYKEKTANQEFELTVKALEKVKVAAIVIKGAAKVEEGADATYTLEVTPDDAYDKSVTWAVDDETVATITESGTLTAIKAGKVKVTATAKDGSEIKGELEVTVEKPLPTEPITIAAANALEKGEYAYIEGKVVGTSGRGYVLRDATGLMYVYAFGAEDEMEKNFFYEVGDSIYVIGKRDYYNVIELVPITSDYLLEEVELDDIAATMIDKDALDAYVAKPAEGETKEYPVQLVGIEGKLSISADGKYYNIIIDGTENQGSISYILEDDKANYENDKTYTFYGYAVGHSSNKYMNIMLAPYDPPLPPYEEVYVEGALYVNPAFTAESCSWGGHALTFGTDGFALLIDAVNAATDGQTIYLQSGEYELTPGTACKIDKNLTFVGPNAGIPGWAAKRYPEAKFNLKNSSESGSTDITIGASLYFDGVALVGQTPGYASGIMFEACETTTGVTIKNSLLQDKNTIFKVQKGTDANYVIDSCWNSGVSQFFAWVTAGTKSFTYINNVFDAEGSGAVGNANAALFRFLCAGIEVKIFNNTFINDEAETNAGWFEFGGGDTAKVYLQYNNFRLVNRFFFNRGQAMASVIINNNIITDGDNAVLSEVPVGYKEVAGYTVGTDTYESEEAMKEAWEAIKATLLPAA